MKRRNDIIVHDQNLRVGVNKIDVTRRHDTTSRRQPLHGFTLIELLVVIAIIALLLSIVMPSLSRAKTYAQRMLCANNLRQQTLGILLYANENDSRVMESYAGNWLWDQSFWTTYTMSQYAGFDDNKTFFCPSNNSAQHDDARFWQYSWIRLEQTIYPNKVPLRDESYLPLSVLKNYHRVLPYVYNIDKRNRNTGASLLPDRLLTGESARWIHKLTDLQSPSTTFMVMDAVISDGNDRRFFDISSGAIPAISGGSLLHQTNHRSRQTIEGGSSSPWGANVSYADGHVTWKQFGPLPPESEMKHKITTGGMWFWW